MKLNKRLLIISDTPMWTNSEGTVSVYEPTLREIENISSLFSEILWIGFQRQNYSFGNGRSTIVSAIKFRLLPSSGGHTPLSVIKSLILLPYYLVVIPSYMIRYQYIHTRGPSVPALIGTLYSFLFPWKKYWYKYAGNWNATHSPFFYQLQKKLLMKAKFGKVTLNGKWPDQLPHTLTVDNPCFSGSEMLQARTVIAGKKYVPPFVICFAGRLEEAKGIGNFLKALSGLTEKHKISKILLAGDGDRRKTYETLAASTGLEIEFLGSLNRERLNQVYAQSHFMILPSRSEGFPKVLAEAMAFGCIPIITGVSAIRQYINDGENGFLLPDNQPGTIRMKLELILKREDLQKMALTLPSQAETFTYEYFKSIVSKKVLELDP